MQHLFKLTGSLEKSKSTRRSWAKGFMCRQAGEGKYAQVKIIRANGQ